MMLYDYSCVQCMRVVLDVDSTVETNTILRFCPKCKMQTIHSRIINGGVRGRRYRCNDFPPAHSPYWRDQVEVVPAVDGHAASTDGEDFKTPIEDMRTGKPVALDADKSQERRERRRHRQRKEWGQTPIYNTGKK